MSARRKWMKIGATLLVIGGVTWGAIEGVQRYRAHQATLAAQRASEIIADAANKKDYGAVRRAVDAGLIDPKTVHEAVRQEFQRQAMIRVDKYFAIADPKARSAYLDSVIDEQESLRAYQKAHPTTNPASGDGWQSQVVSWALSQPPDTRAHLAEFHGAMERRRAERGLASIFDGNSIMKRIFGGGKPTQ